MRSCPDEQDQQHDEAGPCHHVSFSTSLDSVLRTFKLTSDIVTPSVCIFMLDPSEVPRSQGSTLPGLPICLAEPASLGLPNVAPLEPVI